MEIYEKTIIDIIRLQLDLYQRYNLDKNVLRDHINGINGKFT